MISTDGMPRPIPIKRLGVLGGTFNPIHSAHVSIAEEYARGLALERMVIVPAALPPHKEAGDLAPGPARLAMCRLATRHAPLFTVCDYEVEQGGKSYTYKTLRYLRGQYPGCELFLIMGGDMFLTVSEWRAAAEIFRLATLCGAPREEAERALMQVHRGVLEAQGARCVLLPLAAWPLSSTRLREMVAADEDTAGLLHPDVRAYIDAHGLYRYISRE